MEQEALYFGEDGIIRSAFYKNKKPVIINEVDIKRITLPDKKSYGKASFKYFIGYRHEGNIFNIFKTLTICFDLVPKSLYSFISTLEEIIFIDSISK